MSVFSWGSRPRCDYPVQASLELTRPGTHPPTHPPESEPGTLLPASPSPRQRRAPKRKPDGLENVLRVSKGGKPNFRTLRWGQKSHFPKWSFSCFSFRERTFFGGGSVVWTGHVSFTGPTPRGRTGALQKFRNVSLSPAVGPMKEISRSKLVAWSPNFLGVCVRALGGRFPGRLAKCQFSSASGQTWNRRILMDPAR